MQLRKHISVVRSTMHATCGSVHSTELETRDPKISAVECTSTVTEQGQLAIKCKDGRPLLHVSLLKYTSSIRAVHECTFDLRR